MAAQDPPEGLPLEQQPLPQWPGVALGYTQQPPPMTIPWPQQQAIQGQLAQAPPPQAQQSVQREPVVDGIVSEDEAEPPAGTAQPMSPVYEKNPE